MPRKNDCHDQLHWLLLAGLGFAFAFPAYGGDGSKDPNLWLEDVAGAKSLAWVKQQNASVAGLTKGEEFTALKDRLLKIFDSNERIPYVAKSGDHYYNFWRDAKNPRGLWRRTTLDEYRKAKPDWEIVLDLDALGRDREGELGLAGSAGSAARVRAAPAVAVARRRRRQRGPRVRPDNQDRSSRTASRCPRPRARSPGGTGQRFRRHRLRPGLADHSGYPRIVKEWKRGTPLAEARLVFEGKPEDMSVGADRDLTPGLRARRSSCRGATFCDLRDVPAPRRQARQDRQARRRHGVRSTASGCSSQLRSDWTVGGKTYPAGALLATDLEAFLKGTRHFDVLFEPTERKSLAGFSPTRNHSSAQRARQRAEPRLCPDAPGRPMAPRAAAGRARVRRRRVSTTSTPTIPTTTS